MYSIPDPGSTENVSDWAEFYLVSQKEELSRAELSSFIEGSSGSEPPDEFINSVWLELESREALYGENPPYCVQRGLLQPNIDWEEYPEYMTCLIFALEGNPIESLKSGVLFERITNEAVGSFLGGESIVVGFPNIKEVVDIATALGEKFASDPPWYRKDRDLDVVAWKPFGDQRASQVIILIQCAAGRNWTEKKPVSLGAWRKYIHFACTPIKGFSIPVIISDKVRLEDVSTDLGLIIDRARIYRNMIEGALKDSSLRKDLKEWCTIRLKAMES